MNDTTLRRVRVALAARGWPLGALARRLGMQRSNLSAWLHGREDRQRVGLPDLAAVLGVEVAQLEPGGPCPACGSGDRRPPAE